MLVENQDIPGLELIENFISNDEENKLINHIYKNNWDTTIKRRVQHYGINFEYKFRKIEKNMEPKEFPDWMNLILDKLKDIKVLKNFNPNQCTINEYEPGVGIAPHIDTHSCFGKISKERYWDQNSADQKIHTRHKTYPTPLNHPSNHLRLLDNPYCN